MKAPEAKFLMHHASAYAFEFPDYDRLRANSTGHENGMLGLWVASSSDWIQNFGTHVYVVEVDGSMMDLPIGELSKWAKENDGDPDFYVGVRNSLLARGIDYLRLVEVNGTSAMGIVINFQAIRSFSPMPCTVLKPIPLDNATCEPIEAVESAISEVDYPSECPRG